MSALGGKTALVTGSSRGIGAAIAKLFAREGAGVAVHGRDAAALSQVRGEIQQAGGQAIEIQGDVTQFNEIEAMRREIEEEQRWSWPRDRVSPPVLEWREPSTRAEE